LSPLIYQYVNQKLYGDLIDSYFKPRIEGRVIEVPELTGDEENILRYAAGYVPYKLLKKYEKTDSVGVMECLTAMAVNGEEGDLLQYTTKWIEIVNRGGLFELNDTAYAFFREIEKEIRKHLYMCFHQHTAAVDQRETIIHSTASNDDVQFYWTMLSVDIESEKQAAEVLKQIIGLWLNARGFSLAGSWLDTISKQSSVKSKGLRKTLKRQSTCTATSATENKSTTL
jgi:hypothetical protein